MKKKLHKQADTKKAHQSAGHDMGGMFGNVTKKKPELDEQPPKRSQLKPKGAARKKRLEGVKL